MPIGSYNFMYMSSHAFNNASLAFDLYKLMAGECQPDGSTPAVLSSSSASPLSSLTIHATQAVSYTHLTLPTICSV
eukprot:911016-Karenia_brevis.AAC.1